MRGRTPVGCTLTPQMKYAIQNSNFEYVVYPTETSLEKMFEVIKSFAWDNELHHYRENKNIGKIYPSLDIQDENKEEILFCSYVKEKEFEVSFFTQRKDLWKK